MFIISIDLAILLIVVQSWCEEIYWVSGNGKYSDAQQD
jgi:hypothetical protein